MLEESVEIVAAASVRPMLPTSEPSTKIALLEKLYVFRTASTEVGLRPLGFE